MIAQRRMLESLFGATVEREAEDESPQARSVTARCADESAVHTPGHVVQRKELSAAKLNVAGEEHGESGSRRASEREYAADKGVNSYWQEGEFTYMPQATLPWETPKETHGDPFMLRAEYLLALLDEKHGERLLNQFALGNIPAVSNLLGSSLAEAWKKYCSDWLVDAVWEPAVALARASRSEGEQEKAAGFRPHYDLLMDLKQKVQERQNITDPALIKAAASQTMQAIKHVRSEFTNSYLIGGFFRRNRPEDVISRDRSDAMLKAAKESRKRGLWKIGDSHVSDIRAKAEIETAEYRLMSRTEFNEDYKKWHIDNRQEEWIADYLKVKDSRDKTRITDWYRRVTDGEHNKAFREYLLGRSHVERMWIDLDDEPRKQVIEALNRSDKFAAVSALFR